MISSNKLKYLLTFTAMMVVGIFVVSDTDGKIVFHDNAPQSLRIIYSGRLMGNVEPCG